MNAPAVADGIDAVPRSAPAATIFLAIGRATAVLFFSLCALIEIAAIMPFVRAVNRVHVRAAWLHVWCRFACRVLGIHVRLCGSMPRSGLLVCNHLSYLDIIVLSSITPCVFVAKANVAAWPLFGWLTRAAGAIFVDRRRKLSSAAAVEEMREAKLVIPGSVLLAGILLCSSSMSGTPDYAKKEKKACTFCHAKVVSDKSEMVKNLNSSGKCYKDNEHSLAKCASEKD